MSDLSAPFAREAEVTADDRARLVDAIKSAYPNRDFFYLLLANKMAIQVGDDVISLANPGTIVASAVVEHARANGKTLELLGMAWADRPGNPALAALADRLLPDRAAVLAKFAPADAGPAGPRPSLERLIERRSRLLNLSAFQEGLARLAGALCLVDTGVSKGTGFLVGRRTVLTNHHVVEAALAAGLPGEDVSLVFDFADAGKPNVVVPAAASWASFRSRHSQSDLTGTGEPGPDELDFALVTLARDVEPERPALAWPAAPPVVAQRDFLLIGQHPEGGAARIAFGEVVEMPRSGLRYRYDATTQPGSSGSPVLDLDLRLVGLHHAADPAGAPRYNQAVPIARIMAHLKAQGLELASL